MSILLVMLLLGVLQVGVYLHVRNVVAASAAEGARYASNADVGVDAGGPRATEVIRRSLGGGVATSVSCTARQVPGAAGSTLVAVHCAGNLPVIFAPFGRVLPLQVTARALREGP